MKSGARAARAAARQPSVRSSHPSLYASSARRLARTCDEGGSARGARAPSRTRRARLCRAPPRARRRRRRAGPPSLPLGTAPPSFLRLCSQYSRYAVSGFFGAFRRSAPPRSSGSGALINWVLCGVCHKYFHTGPCSGGLTGCERQPKCKKCTESSFFVEAFHNPQQSRTRPAPRAHKPRLPSRYV